MSPVLAWSIAIAQIMLGLAMGCATLHMIRGPRAQDRVLGFDCLYVNAMLLLVTFGIRSGGTLYFEAALTVALLGFVGGAGQVSAARRGDRMNAPAGVSTLATMLTAVLLVAGAAITLIGAIGLLRLRTFYERTHAPTLGTTLGTACIAVASMIYFSALETRPVVHELLLVTFIFVTTPVTLIILVRAAQLRDQFEGGENAHKQPNSSGPR
jgi:multicomponent K+:H+ antiporter subunit G